MCYVDDDTNLPWPEKFYVSYPVNSYLDKQDN